MARNKDTITTLLGSIKQRPRFSKLVKYSVECLKNLAVDEVSVEEMIDEGALDVLMNVAKLNPYNEEIMQELEQTKDTFSEAKQEVSNLMNVASINPATTPLPHQDNQSDNEQSRKE